ncbi:2OG-Fe(II) oxygenase family protein [Bradyrhizobium sp. DASA03120]|uniref:2OG-Fe(II) oxygenase family protein n=1 Tax=Bradyrhizobium sp. SMVTL-02 TaxID=3395917 RepID=UPI003F6F47F4
MSKVRIPEFSLKALSMRSDSGDLARCVREFGLFYLTDCDLSDEDHRPAREAAMALFKQSTPEQRRELMTKNKSIRRGYSELESESTATVTNTGTYSDYSMCYSMGVSDNLFPSKAFEEIWSRYFSQLYQVARETARAVIRSPGTNKDYDLEDLLDCDPVLRFRYFPEVPSHRVAERLPLRMASHYDLSIVTLIHQTPCANGFVSLQADIGGRSIELPTVPGSMLVMCGAVARIVTQGAVQAPRHHVAAPPACMQAGSERTSSVFFLRPKPSFAFSVAKARQYGLDVSLPIENATFADWIGVNYVAMHTSDQQRTSLQA